MSLPTRLATKQATQQTLARRINTNQNVDGKSYADILFGTTQAAHHAHQHKLPPTTEPVQHSLDQPNRQPPTFNTPHQATQHRQNRREAEDINEGWTQVTRRKVRRTKNERDYRPKPNKLMELLKAQGRCFKCLDRGHTQHQCRNGVKCIKCHGIGHISRMCSTKEKERDVIYTAQLQKAQKHQPSQDKEIQTETLKTETPMDFENWDRLPMLSPDLIQARAPPLTVFFPPNDDLRSPNTLLHRSAVVLLGPRAELVNQLPQRIASTIATTFGCQPGDFKVSTVAPEVGDLLVEFPSNVLRNLAVHVGVFTVARGVEIQLKEWTPNMNMERDPTTHKVRMKLRNVPLQYWNLLDVNHLISGFGYVDRMAPVVINGNFVTLRILVACFDPANIPPSVQLHKNRYATVVFIDIEGWLHNSSPPLHPRFNDDGGQQSFNFGPQRRQRNRQAPRNLDGGYARNRVNETHSRMPTGASSNAFLSKNGETPVKILTRTDRPVQMETSQEVQSENKSEAPTVKWVNFEQNKNFVHFHAICDNGKILNARINVSLLTEPEVSPIWELLPTDQQKDASEAETEQTQVDMCTMHETGTGGSVPPATEVILEGLNSETTAPNQEKAQLFKQAGQLMGSTEFTMASLLKGKGPQDELRSMGQNKGLQNEVSDTTLMAGEERQELSNEGPPPGFERPPRYKRTARRSPRLQKKNTGRYISAVDRARATRGFINVCHLMQRVKKRTKAAAKPSLEYLKSYDPLTQGHAEAVVSTAGVELSEELQKKIEEAAAAAVPAAPVAGTN